MKRDFTLKAYTELLHALRGQGYTFIRFDEFMTTSSALPERFVILRHDIDARKLHSLEFARIQAVYGIKGTYFFRMIPASYSRTILKQIKCFGHEIGYHYEDMDFARKQSPAGTSEQDLYDKAWVLFGQHLETLRTICPITTISMHGSPRSRYDNKALWQKYNFRELGIIGEPYLDIDFNEVAYFTDTGRRWNGQDVSIRDKVKGKFDFNFRTTRQIIENMDQLPDKVMFTFHPQRWTDRPLPWLRELVMQNVKNVVKAVLVKRNWNEEG